jgi:hypothetical protein
MTRKARDGSIKQNGRTPRPMAPRPLHPDEYFNILATDCLGTDAEPWVVATKTLDHCGDKKPLLELLKSERAMPRAARLVLADLLGRYQLKPRPGRPAIPVYTLAKQHVALKIARAHYDELRRDGMKREEALERAANEGIGGPVVKQTLEDYLKGKIAGYRRAEKRFEDRRSDRPKLPGK